MSYQFDATVTQKAAKEMRKIVGQLMLDTLPMCDDEYLKEISDRQKTSVILLEQSSTQTNKNMLCEAEQQSQHVLAQ